MVTKGVNPSRPFISESGIKTKFNLKIPKFSVLCGASKGFLKVFKTFIKPFEASQRSVKVSI